jgi:hypothetical protein
MISWEEIASLPDISPTAFILPVSALLSLNYLPFCSRNPRMSLASLYFILQGTYSDDSVKLADRKKKGTDFSRFLFISAEAELL